MVLKTDKLSLQVQLDPAATGNNSVHLYAFTPTGAPQQVQEWTGFAAQPEKGVDKVEVPLLPITANHAVGDVSLPTAGRWKLSFTLRTTDVDEVTLSRDVTIQ
jgi:copper transport protein